jgi:hypothetical protein
LGRKLPLDETLLFILTKFDLAFGWTCRGAYTIIPLGCNHDDHTYYKIPLSRLTTWGIGSHGDCVYNIVGDVENELSGRGSEVH